MSTANLPLRGIRVLDLSRLAAGNMLTLQLADFGAEVIKVESPLGDTLRDWKTGEKALWWKIYARNKKSVCLNLKNPLDVEKLLRLIPGTALLVESFKVGELEKFGLAPKTLHAINPRLVILRISGWGQDGPYAKRPGFGTLVEAFSGFAEKNGFPDKPPALPNLGLADMIAGLSGVSAALSALREVEVNAGQGQVIDLSLFEPMLAVLGPDAAIFRHTGKLPRRVGNRAEIAAPRNAYLSKDQRWLVISGSTQEMTRKIFQAIGQDHLIKDPRFSSNAARLENSDTLDQLIGSFVETRTLDENLAHFEDFGVAIGPIYNVSQLLEDPHVCARSSITEIEDFEIGSIPMHNVFPRFSGTPGTIRSLGPSLGEHQAILDEIDPL